MTIEQNNVESAETVKDDNNNSNKIKRIDELHSEQQAAYHEAIEAATAGNENNITVKKSIQKAAFALEEIFQLHGQEDMSNQIGSIIVRDLKTRGFPESKYKYVYEALEAYDDRFVKGIDHSSVQSVGELTKPLELFYHNNAERYYSAIRTLKGLKDDYPNLLRRDIQTIVPECMDIFDENEKLCKRESIQLPSSIQHSFEGGPEKFEDPIRIQKPVSKIPELMTEELNIWINTFLPSLLKKFTDYPINDRALEKRMAAGWAAIRHAHDPTTDDKYRKSYYDWITIVQFADESFKHHAASKFKTQDFRGQWRKLTREQIGARQKTIPLWCKWFFETVPGFMEEIAWSRTDKEPRLSGFSIDLSPKLSDRSIK